MKKLALYFLPPLILSIVMLIIQTITHQYFMAACLLSSIGYWVWILASEFFNNKWKSTFFFLGLASLFIITGAWFFPLYPTLFI